MSPSLSRHSDLLVRYLSPQRSRVLLLAVLLFSSIALELISPQIVRIFIDTAQRGGPGNALTVAAVSFLAAALCKQGVALAATYTGTLTGWQATNALRADLLQHCLGLDLAFHKDHTPGELIERIDGDVTLLANFFSQFTITILGNALLVAGILVVMARTNVWLGIGLTVYSLVTVAVLYAFQKRAVVSHTADRQASAEQYGAIEERLVGTEDIRGVGAEHYVLERLLSVMQRRLRTNRSALLAGNLTFFAINFLYWMAYALGLAAGAFLFSHHQITLGTAFAIVFYIGMLGTPLDKIRLQIQDMQQASACVARVDTLLRTQSRLVTRGSEALPPGALRVQLEHVNFGYDDGASVLNDISLSLDAGQTLGLLGRTGSGKTTLTRLLARLYDPRDGTVRLDGVDVRNLAPATMGDRVGMVTQNVQLFRATVRDNLTFFHPRLMDADILTVFRELDLWEWYQSLPNGLDTMLGAGGAGLSAGQSQLLAFTRVFLRDPGLVILDEASSRLDPATERLVERAIDRLLQGRTGVIVAHRLKTIARTDNIMILDGGEVAEFGPRLNLVQDPASRFSLLLRTGMEEVLV